VSVKIDQTIQRSRKRIERLIAQVAQTPVVFDEARDGSEVGDPVIHIILFGVGTDQQQGRRVP
jgi:hypothetical protein